MLSNTTTGISTALVPESIGMGLDDAREALARLTLLTCEDIITRCVEPLPLDMMEQLVRHLSAIIRTDPSLPWEDMRTENYRRRYAILAALMERPEAHLVVPVLLEEIRSWDSMVVAANVPTTLLANPVFQSEHVADIYWGLSAKDTDGLMVEIFLEHAVWHSTKMPLRLKLDAMVTSRDEERMPGFDALFAEHFPQYAGFPYEMRRSIALHRREHVPLPSYWQCPPVDR